MTFSCEQRLPLLGDPRIRDLFARSPYTARARFAFALYAWVVMREHVHLLLQPANGVTMDRILKFIKLAVGQRVIARWREIDCVWIDRIMRADGRPHFWQKGGGFDRNVRSDAEFAKEVRYIHRNPVERGLVERPEDWAWSSARWWMGIRDGVLPCDPFPPRNLREWKGFV